MSVEHPKPILARAEFITMAEFINENGWVENEFFTLTEFIEEAKAWNMAIEEKLRQIGQAPTEKPVMRCG